MEDPIVTAAQLAFSIRLKDNSNVSDNTKNAQAIGKAWRGAVHELAPDRFQIEALVAPDLDQKIDIMVFITEDSTGDLFLMLQQDNQGSRHRR